MRLCDSHLHVGEFYRQYNSPWTVLRLVRELGLSRVAVSSTTTCRFPPDALKEMKRLVRYGGSRIVPVLWLTKWMLDSGFAIEALFSGIRWGCLKVHGELEPGVWQSGTAEMSRVVGFARSMRVPLLIHTGETGACNAGIYADAVRANPDVKFIFAHGRPLDETAQLLSLPNAYTDTAFMPVEHVGELVEAGFAGKALWGTDAPINRHYFRDIPTVKYCHRRLNEFYHAVTDPAARRMILNDNFQKLFGGD